jgi:hypothetical protein
MRSLIVGIRIPTGVLKAESGPLADDEADRQLAEVTRQLAARGDVAAVLQLSWLSVPAADVLYARTDPPPGAHT